MSHIAKYLDNEARRGHVADACKLLRHVEFDAIAVRGVSGLIIGPEVASRLKKELIVVRKHNDGSHSNLHIEVSAGVWLEDSKYIVLDDFTETGKTVRTIVQEIYDNHGTENFRCVGLYFYDKPQFKSLVDFVEQKGDYNLPRYVTDQTPVVEPKEWTASWPSNMMSDPIFDSMLDYFRLCGLSPETDNIDRSLFRDLRNSILMTDYIVPNCTVQVDNG